MWRLEKAIREAKERVEQVREEKEELSNGVVKEGILVETPRKKHERHVYWSVEKRAAQRRDQRNKVYARIEEKESKLVKKEEVAYKRLFRRNRLPKLHRDILRHVDIESDEFKAEVLKNPNRIGPHAYTGLHLAVSRNREDLVDILLAAPGCNVNAQDATGYTPLHLALPNPKALSIVKKLMAAGADLTIRSREGLDPVEVALSHGMYHHMAHFLEGFTIWELASMRARRFFLDYMDGNPNHHHYKRQSYEHEILIAYVVVNKPKVLQRSINMQLVLRRVTRNVRTMNNLERFYHDFIGRHFYNRNYEIPFGQKKKSEVHANAVDVAAEMINANLDHPDDLKVETTLEQKSLHIDGNAYAGMDTDPVDSVRGIFFEFPKERVRKWQVDALEWKFSHNTSVAPQIAKFAFGKKWTPQQVTEGLAEGRRLFDKWRSENVALLEEDENRRMTEVADAMKLRALREEREAKREEQRIQEEKLKAERAKRGLDKIDSSACIIVSTDVLTYFVDQGQSVEYSIELGSRPTGPVLIKFGVEPSGRSGDAMFNIAPSLTTFTPFNWDLPQFVTVTPTGDEDIVRLKRYVAKKEPCDHRVTQTIQSTTDWSYRNLDLKWTPTQNLQLLVR
mmetsp:Transcript_11277/g.20840  ORF Transcript_11277/g.20840 Transcript_11277/m.20840 type:complete len:621 (+) Transcript_11277:167-2029(+)